MFISNICCCCQDQNKVIGLESKPYDGVKQTTTIEQQPVEDYSNNHTIIAKETGKAITEQPKITVTTEQITIEDDKLSTELSFEKLDNNKENQLTQHKRPISDSIAYDLKKQYEGMNNFAFVDDIDFKSEENSITKIEENTKNINITTIDMINTEYNNGDVSTDNCINIDEKSTNSTYAQVIRVTTTNIKNEEENDNKLKGNETPPKEEDLNFDERRRIMIANSFDQFLEHFNDKTDSNAKHVKNYNDVDEVDESEAVVSKVLPVKNITVTNSETDLYKHIRLSCLEAHNRLRAQHGCPLLKESDELNQLAEDWGNYLMETNCKMVHRPNNKYGENLFWTNQKNGHVTMAVQAWYDEIKLYDFRNHGFSKETGHFTQLIWRDTVELGTAFIKKDSDIIVVCNYNPPGNYDGEFNDYTVPPLTAEDKLTNKMIKQHIEKIRESSLTAHNRLRTLHGCPPLQKSEELDIIAEKTLDCVEVNNGIPEKPPKISKAIGWNFHWSESPFIHVTQAIQFWYDDGFKLYNNNQPIPKNKESFIQLIWRDTLQLGTAVRRIENDIWTVCIYNPSKLSEDMFNDYFIPRLTTDKRHLTLENAPEEMRQSCLEAHNRLRSDHGCPPLIRNPELDKMAEEWAEHLAEVNKLYHRSNSKYGENLFWTNNKLGHVTMAVQSWYNEIKLYDYNNPDFCSEAGHFTQLIWRDSIELGTGVARRGDALYIVCVYNPPGNYIGKFNDYYIPRPIKSVE